MGKIVCGTVALFTVAGWFASVSLVGEMAVHFKVFYFLGALVSAAVFAMRGKRPWLIGALALAAVHMPGLAVWYLPADPVIPDGTGTPLRIVSANVMVSNTKHDLFLEFIRETDPDIIFIQELNDSWAKSLQALKETYAHYALKPQPDPFGIALFSRFALDSVKIMYNGEPDMPSVHAELTVNGRHLSVLCYHTWAPKDREHLEIRDKALEYLAKYAADADDLVIVAGDLNATPWTPSYQSMIRDSRLKNARQGYGIKPTWSNVPSPIGLLPLDHVLVSPEIAVDDFRLGPPIGSDHRPLVVDLRIPAKPGE